MNDHQVLAASDLTVLGAEEVDYDKLTRAELLGELRAMRIVVAHLEERFASAKACELALQNLQVAYRAALDACARAEARNQELQQRRDSLGQ